MIKFLSFKLLVILGFAALSAAAQGQKEVMVTMDVKKVTRNADGKEALDAADSAKPGDILQYSAVYANKTSKKFRDLEATIPIPAYTTYVPGSTRPAGAKASLDGQNFQAIPLRRKVKQPDGKEIMQLVPYAEYRYVRWYPGNLSADQELKFSARVKVLSYETPAAPGAETAGEGEKK